MHLYGGTSSRLQVQAAVSEMLSIDDHSKPYESGFVLYRKEAARDAISIAN